MVASAAAVAGIVKMVAISAISMGVSAVVTDITDEPLLGAIAGGLTGAGMSGAFSGAGGAAGGAASTKFVAGGVGQGMEGSLFGDALLGGVTESGGLLSSGGLASGSPGMEQSLFGDALISGGGVAPAAATSGGGGLLDRITGFVGDNPELTKMGVDAVRGGLASRREAEEAEEARNFEREQYARGHETMSDEERARIMRIPGQTNEALFQGGYVPRYMDQRSPNYQALLDDIYRRKDSDTTTR